MCVILYRVNDDGDNIQEVVNLNSDCLSWECYGVVSEQSYPRQPVLRSWNISSLYKFCNEEIFTTKRSHLRVTTREGD